MPSLVLLRHGESAWNAEDRFTGWVDVPLTARGAEQARHSGRLLREHGLLPDVVHASLLSRALDTAQLLLEAADLPGAPVRTDWRLNERCYGALQGQPRASVREAYGDEQFQRWRRSYDAAPPPLAAEWAHATAEDPRYVDVPVPLTESLADVSARLLPLWRGAIAADLLAGRCVVVVGHGNSLRALVAHLDALSPHEVTSLNIPTGMPLHYDLDGNLVPTTRGGRYLEPAAAAAAAAAVAAEGTSTSKRPPRRPPTPRMLQ